MSQWWQIARAWWAYQQGLMLRFMGHRGLQRGLYARSAEAFSNAIRFVPDFAEAYLARGLLYWRELQAPEQAIADFSMLLTVDPRRAEALFYRAMAHQARGDYAQAALDLRAALAQGQYEAWYANAQHQLATVEAILEELPARLSPGDPQA